MTYINTFKDKPTSYTQQYESRTYKESDFSTISVCVVRGDKGQYVLLFNNLQPLEDDTQKSEQISSAPFNVNDCVVKCQGILGLKINEIAKLSGVSRATLDLHRKGANVKDMSGYQQLYNFVSIVEKKYGNSIKKGIRNVLVGRKTLLQHFLQNSADLETTLPLIEEVSEKIKGMSVLETDMDSSKSHLRLSRIGKSM